MRSTISLLLALALLVSVHAQEVSLIPYPAEITYGQGKFPLKNKITVNNNFPEPAQTRLFNYLRDEFKKQYKITVVKAAKGQKADINFSMERMPTGGKPAYRLQVKTDGILISSNFDESAFHGIQTLMQLVPLSGPTDLPVVNIFDHPRFGYRGMHLDVARHFFPVSFIKKYIDYLAYHKFNTFHWHLTEDQGWRIEIKKYPKLTSVGGYRNGTIIGRHPGKGNDNLRYGGFYTQAEIKEVVKYAKDRFIDVIPEIEMPGHGSAAIAAYPWLSCFPDQPTAIPASMISKKSIEEQNNGRIKLVQETWGVFNDVFCAGKDSTFIFLQNVLDEVIPLFPSKYVHIGGDECPKTHWKICPSCQQRMKALGLKDEHELQSYFIQRIEKYLNSKGKTIIGWDEILEGGLAPNAIVMSWRGEAGGIEAAKQKHNVIMTPGNPVYFDHTQSLNEDSVTIGGYNPIEKVYAYEPVPKELNAEEGKYVLGAQANMWTEYMKNTRKVDYMLFPRISALAEVLWSPRESRNWSSFEKRLQGQFKRYDKWKSNYSKAYFDLKTTVIPSSDNSGVLWKIENKNKEYNVIYTQSETTSATIPYTEPIRITSSVKPQAVLQDQQHRIVGTWVSQAFHFNKATGKKITLAQPATSKYPGDGPFTLVNGIQNEKGMARTQEFLGFEALDCIATIDLGAEMDISEIVVHHLEQTPSWIYAPSAIDIAGSGDGTVFSPVNSAVSLSRSSDRSKTTLKLAKTVKTRFIKVSIFNHGKIAEGNPGAGHGAWLFIDEIEVL
jgi:hexosaminidase